MKKIIELQMMKKLLHKKLAKIEEEINQIKGDINNDKTTGIQITIS
jgi:hypothetical protein